MASANSNSSAARQRGGASTHVVRAEQLGFSAEPLLHPTLDDYRLVRCELQQISPKLRVCHISSIDGNVLEVFGRVPKGAALRKIRRNEVIPSVRWRTPTGGLFAFDIADIRRLVSAARIGEIVE